MYYEITIDFEDGSPSTTMRFNKEGDVSLYLERIPGMIGFITTGCATVKLEKKPVDRFVDLPIFDDPNQYSFNV